MAKVVISGTLMMVLEQFLLKYLVIGGRLHELRRLRPLVDQHPDSVRRLWQQILHMRWCMLPALNLSSARSMQNVLPPYNAMIAILVCALASAATAQTDLHTDIIVEPPFEQRAARHLQACVDGMAGGYACQNIDLLAHLPLSDIGGGSGSDIWGWTDPVSGREFALMGRSNGTAFVELIGHPEHVLYLGNLPPHAGSSTWRDIKTFGHYAFIGSEAEDSGMQVFDLNQLLDVASPPVTFSETAHYDAFGRSHNIVINEQTAIAFAVGSRQGTETCNSGLHIIDISAPLSPSFLGCFSTDGYTHDAQCVNYKGPDEDYAGSQICFNSNEDTVTIVDVTDPSNTSQISRTGYDDVGYTHQGWLTEDHRFFLLDDETDEIGLGHNTRTIIWDVQDLDNPEVIGEYFSDLPASDHNLYVKDNYAYQANYRAGLRILNLDDVGNGIITEAAYFDTFPGSDANGTSGAWSVYPYFDSETVIVSDISNGLFVLRPILCTEPAVATDLTATAAGDNTIELNWTHGDIASSTFDIYRSIGACPADQPELIATGVSGSSYLDLTASGQVSYAYEVRAKDKTGQCTSPPSDCSAATTTGVCNAAPSFAGVSEVANLGTSECALQVSWPAASPNCGSEVSYNVYGSQSPAFVPSPSNLVAGDLDQLSTIDTEVFSQLAKHFVVRSVDQSNGSEDGNLLRIGETPTGPSTVGTWATGAELGDPTMGQGSNRHIGWELISSRARSGDRSFFSTYNDGQCSRLITPLIELSALGTSDLSLWTLYDIESRWDGGVVEISSDGGDNWSLLTPSSGYPNTFRSSSDACGYPEGTGAFTGTNLNWTPYSFDLAAYAGAEIQIRFSFSTDGAVTQEGWYLDDIALSNAIVPGMCLGLEDIIFDQGFEP